MNLSRSRFSFAALIALASIVDDAWAQNTSEPSALPKIQVDAQGDDDEGYAPARTRAGTKTDTPLIEVPQSITVISAAQIQDQNAQNMQEVLRYTAGVRADLYGLDNRGDWFTLRGGSEGSTLLDGLRLPLSGSWGIVRNEPYAFERVEVLRGPASVIAGQNGPGGVVNLVSKRPRADAVRDVTVQFGNYDHKQLATDLSGPITQSETLRYRLVALGKDSNTQVDHAFDRRQFVAPSLAWQMTDAASITVYGEYQHDDTGNTNAFFPWAGTLLPAPNGPIPTDTFIGEPSWDTYGGHRTRLGYEFAYRLNDSWSLRQDVRHDDVKGKMRTMYAAWWNGFVDAQGAPDPNGRYLNRYWYANDDDARITNADLLAEGALTFGATRHTVLFGVDYMSSRNDRKTWEDLATPLNVYSPVYGTFPLPALADVPTVRYQTRMLGLLVQDQIKVDERWVFVAGLRRDQARSAVKGTNGSDDSAWSKSLGIVYLAAAGVSPYASYSESFESVAGVDSHGAAFKPKRGKQLEAGVKWAPPDAALTATAAIYGLREKNRLSSDPTDPTFSVQRGELEVKGVELEVAGHLRAWDLTANYTYMDARQTSASETDVRYLNKRLTGIPKNSAALWAVRHFSVGSVAGFRVGAGVRYVGETWDGTDSLAVPSNTLLDAMASWDYRDWRYALNVTNLTDKTYIATCLERGDCWFGTRRKISASASYRF